MTDDELVDEVEKKLIGDVSPVARQGDHVVTTMGDLSVGIFTGIVATEKVKGPIFEISFTPKFTF